MDYSRIIHLLVRRYTTKLPADDERELERELQNPDAHRHAREIDRVWEWSGRYRAGYEPDVEAGLSRLKRRMAAGAEARPARGWMRTVWVLAMLLLAALLAYFAYRYRQPAAPAASEPVAAVTGDGETRRLYLSDGTVVTLNAGSRLVSDGFSDEAPLRRVELIGEAFFEVAHRAGQPFVVVTPEMEARVLGTVFNLRAYPAEAVTELTVESGAVQFRTRDGEESLTLRANEKGVCEHGLGLYRETDAGLNARAWQTGTLSFRRTALREVARTLDHYFSVRLELERPEIADCKVNSENIRPEELTEVLGNIAISVGAELRQTGPRQYVLRGGSCR